MPDLTSDLPLSRRALLGTGASLGIGAVLASCSDGSTAAGAPQAPPIDAAAAGLPYRQSDPRWGSDLMWDRDLVLQAATELDGVPKADAAALIREYDDGNNISNEGCQLTCIAMVMRLFDPHAEPAWTPATLNRAAHDGFEYTLSGLSLTTLYPDIAADMTEGKIQLLAKEEYPSGVKPWPPMHVSSSPLARAYLSLSPRERSGVLVMLKTGTYDDTVASHYVLLDPDSTQTPSTNDALILDPAMPLDAKGQWRLSDSAEVITEDPDIASGWKENGITPTRIAGVWAFARWDAAAAKPLIGSFVNAWASELGR
jgi:hypothetical protein